MDDVRVRDALRFHIQRNRGLSLDAMFRAGSEDDQTLKIVKFLWDMFRRCSTGPSYIVEPLSCFILDTWAVIASRPR
jgi:hypothetical protein